MRNKEHRAEYNRAYRQKNLEKLKAYDAARAETQRARALKRYYAHPEENRQKAREWKANNRERNVRYQKEWYEANKPEILEYGRLYHLSHKEARSAYGKKWRSENPEKVRVLAILRRSFEAGASGSHSDLDILNLWERQGGRCVYFSVCGNYLERGGFHGVHRDHIEPLKPLDPKRIPGSNSIDNIQLLCQSCNNRKRNADPYKFTQEYAGRLFPDLPDVPAKRRKSQEVL